MKKLIAVLVTMMLVSTVFACPGGGVIQVTVEDAGKTLLAANYNARSGMRTFMSSRVMSITTQAIDESSVCATESCDQLIQMHEGRRVRFSVTLDDGRILRKTISGVTVNNSIDAVEKASPPMPGQIIGTHDSEGQLILTCSKK